MRNALKATARGLATVCALPSLAGYLLRGAVLGRDRALEGSTQALGLVPGIVGDYVRGAFLARVLAGCAPTVTVRFGTLFSQSGAELEENVYVGPQCHLGLVHLERDVLLGAGVHIPSGAATHGTSRLDVPIREQPGTRTRVRIGAGTWIGSASVVMADVGKHCVIGAGSVVTRPIPDFSVAVGSPAKVIGTREDDPGTTGTGGRQVRRGQGT